MKKFALFLAILTIMMPCQSRSISNHAIIAACVVIPTTYVGSKIYQSIDWTKTERLLRQDKDKLCICLIQLLEKHGNENKTCRSIIKEVKKLQSTPAQQLQDAAQESLDKAKKICRTGR